MNSQVKVLPSFKIVRGPGTAGGETGDLYLSVKVSSDPQFERQGDDLHVTVPVDLYTLIPGGQAQVPTLSVPVMLTIPGRYAERARLSSPGQGVAPPAAD